MSGQPGEGESDWLPPEMVDHARPIFKQFLAKWVLQYGECFPTNVVCP
jgi:hypothetical protein